MRHRPWFAGGLIAMGVGVASTAVLGPLVLGLLDHRTSETTLNQLLGVDAVGGLLVAPMCIAVGFLAWRRHPAAPALALAPATYSVYTFMQVIVGQEYLRVPGNVERFFPLLLAVFILGEVIAVGAWTMIDVDRLPAPSRRVQRLAGGALLAVAAFVVVGLHLPMLPDALSDQPTRVEYVSSPTPFWLVKLMDLGIVVPAAIATGLGLLRGRVWARKAAYVIVGGYALIGASVSAMAIVMLVNGDPDASVAMVIATTTFATVLLALAGALYRPLFGHASQPPVEPAAATPPRMGAQARAQSLSSRSGRF